ncbi:hypothetical protein CTI12_AA301160 [Artemisia annua]|uniref:Uncharacterized protein n=1 Tax=Artemisia annua TaxID=35608 RepID=A0A2U1N6T9_ARTAN|nr:hypothetical protein CTI12_AA301160 [Artemisia annua]
MKDEEGSVKVVVRWLDGEQEEDDDGIYQAINGPSCTTSGVCQRQCMHLIKNKGPGTKVPIAVTSHSLENQQGVSETGFNLPKEVLGDHIQRKV